MKNANIERPNQVLKCIAMIKPKNAPTKCSAKYKAINISFILSFIILLTIDVKRFITLFLIKGEING